MIDASTGMTWFLMRRNAELDKWHPATDNATGSEVYGVDGAYDNSPQGPDTYSIQYNNLYWSKI
ncbi:MAG: hypothetical protein QF535_15855 [Anaerolineales bacterium]|nr:hypothetical protein [Anaerolineales bacterium]